MIRAAETDAELDAYAEIWSAVFPETPMSGAEVRRRLAQRDDGRRYFLAAVDGRPVGTGFAARSEAAERAFGVVGVLPRFRGRGIGSALLDASLTHGRALGSSTLFGSLPETGVGWTARRGFEEFDREVAYVRDLAVDEAWPTLPPGIVIEELTEELTERAFPVYAQGVGDMPDAYLFRPDRERWRKSLADAAVIFVALEGEQVVGWAQLEPMAEDVLAHQLTAVASTHRRRGIGKALKQAELAWAAERGYGRLVTDTNGANVPMQRLNESLGYRALPPRVWVRRPL
jgi:GNAT superfamily N-acetyltransferase